MQSPQTIKMLSDRIATLLLNDVELVSNLQSLSTGGIKKTPVAKRKTKKQSLEDAKSRFTNYSIRSKK